MPNLSGCTVLMHGCKKYDSKYHDNAQSSDQKNLTNQHKVAMKEISPLNKWARISLSSIYRPALKLPTAAMVTDPIITIERRLKLVYRIALEFFFLKNPYPSRPEKLLIAKECGMSYKQISTWFQNRRDRPKDTLMDPNLPNCTVQDLGKYIRRRLHTCSNHYLQPETSIPPEHKINAPVESDSLLNHKKPSREAHNTPLNEANNTPNDIFSFPKPAWIRQKGFYCAKERRTTHPCDVDQMIVGFKSCQLKTPSSSAFTLDDQRNYLSKAPPHPGRIIKSLPRRTYRRQETSGASSMHNEWPHILDPVERVSLPQQITPTSRSCSGSSIISSTDTSDSESVESHLAEKESASSWGQHSVFSPMKLSSSWKLPRDVCFDKVLSWRKGST